MNLKISFILLFSIVILASFLRLYNLSSIPPGLTWDEASLGYNAYSLLQTGKDEYGEAFPLNLKSFGDFKPAVYAYLVIPFIYLLGLNELSVRLPSALLGIGTVIFTYFLILELFKNRSLALASSLAMALSPVAIHFSRPAFETNVALFFNVLGTYLFIKGLKNQKYLIFSVLVFSLSMFTYQASRMFVPLLIGGLVFFYRQNIKFSKIFYLSCLLFLVVLSIFFISTFGSGQAKRLETTSLFSYSRTTDYIDQLSRESGLGKSDIRFQIIHGEWFAFIRGVVERYFIYFSPDILFVEGDYNLRHRQPDLGILPYFSLIFIPIGFGYLIRKRESTENKSSFNIFFFWLFVSTLPAVFSKDLISMIRALNFILPLVVLEGVGLYWIILRAKSINLRVFHLTSAALIMIILLQTLFFFDRYFVHLPHEYASYWLSGYKEAMHSLGKISSEKEFDKIVVSDNYGQPYIYYLFYNQYPPQTFQKQAILDQPSSDVGTIRKIDNIEFRTIYWPDDRKIKNGLFLGSLESLPDQDIKPFPEYKILYDWLSPDTISSFRIVDTEL